MSLRCKGDTATRNINPTFFYRFDSKSQSFCLRPVTYQLQASLTPGGTPSQSDFLEPPNSAGSGYWLCPCCILSSIVDLIPSSKSCDDSWQPQHLGRWSTPHPGLSVPWPSQLQCFIFSILVSHPLPWPHLRSMHQNNWKKTKQTLNIWNADAHTPTEGFYPFS